jgi:SAM-dependent methyltransferase
VATGTDTGGAWQIGGAEGGWWAIERAKLLTERLRPLLGRAGVVVDLGCGRGEVVELLAGAGGAFVVGLDIEVHDRWRERVDGAAFVVGAATHVPLREASAGLVGCFDVIEHFADDGVPLRAARALTRPDGHVAVTVPAFPGVWSSFDERVGHHRRYTADALDAATRRAGLDPGDRTTYFFSWLLPAAWLLRRRDRTGADDTHDGPLGRAVASVAAALSGAERRVLRRRRVPFGTSIWTLCRRTDRSTS